MANTILDYCDNQIGILTINRPEALNALNSELVSELSRALTAVETMDLRCLIVTGAGDRAFVAGADVSEMKDLTPEAAKKFSREGNRLMEQLVHLPVPVIAALNGYALGGGLELALACDIRVASERAVCAFPEAGLGILPGYGGIQRLSRLIGIARAKELLFTANRIRAREALNIGLVNAVVPHESLMVTCRKMAEQIAENAPAAVRSIKRIANASEGITEKEAVGMETGYFAQCFETEDQKNAMRAFVEKRQPSPFTGK